MRRAQGALEFTLITIVMMLVFATSIIIAEYQYIAAAEQRQDELAERTLNIIEAEFQQALAAGDGFQRMFYMPHTLGGVEYEIFVNTNTTPAAADELIIIIDGKKYVRFLKVDVERMNPGDDVLQKGYNVVYGGDTNVQVAPTVSTECICDEIPQSCGTGTDCPTTSRVFTYDCGPDAVIDCRGRETFCRPDVDCGYQGGCTLTSSTTTAYCGDENTGLRTCPVGYRVYHETYTGASCTESERYVCKRDVTCDQACDVESTVYHACCFGAGAPDVADCEPGWQILKTTYVDSCQSPSYAVGEYDDACCTSLGTTFYGCHDMANPPRSCSSSELILEETFAEGCAPTYSCAPDTTNICSPVEWHTGFERFTKRARIVIDPLSPGGATQFSAFPVAVRLSDTHMPDGFSWSMITKNTYYMDGPDVEFVTMDGTVLNHAVARWEPPNSAQFWVFAPVPVDTSHVFLYFGYSDAAPPTPPPATSRTAVTADWASLFKSVYHLDEEPYTEIPDHTGVADVVPRGLWSGANLVPGAYDWAYVFPNVVDASNRRYLETDTSEHDFSVFTASAWVYVPDGGVTGSVVVREDSVGNALYEMRFPEDQCSESSCVVECSVLAGASPVSVQAPVPRDAWSFVACVQSSDTLSVHVNGRLEQSVSATGSAGTGTVTRFGGGYSCVTNDVFSRCFSGELDEVRLSNTARSDYSLWLEYLDGTGALLTYLSVESQ